MWQGRRQCVWVLVCLATLGQVRSQVPISDLPTGTPSIPTEEAALRGGAEGTPRGAIQFVNGPTGISVEELHHRAAGVRDFVNGPTGTSVDAEERRPPEGVDFISGPTGISVETQEMKAEQLEEVMPPASAPPGSGPPEEAPIGKVIGHSTTSTSTSVSGPTLTSVATVQGEVRTGSDGGGRSNSRGVISTDPRNGPGITQLPPGLHIDTTDWSRDSGLWSYAGGDWALVNLPDPQHPAIPTPDLPGKALVVVTKELLKKVYVKRVFRGLSNVILHYSFFLSQGLKPHGEPTLKVYQVSDNKTQLLASERSRGAWSDNTIHLPDSDAFTIVFEGRLIKEGNEIAVDDITISGNSLGGLEFARTESTHDNTTQAPEAVLTSQDASQVYNEENGTSGQTPEFLDEGATENETAQDGNTDYLDATTPAIDTENGKATDKSEKTDELGTENPVSTDDVEDYNNATTDWAAENVEMTDTDEGDEQGHDAPVDWQNSELVNANDTVDTTDLSENGTDLTFAMPGENMTTLEGEGLSPGPTAETSQGSESNQTENTAEVTRVGTGEPTDDNVTSSVLPTQSNTPDNTTLPLVPSQSQQTNEETTQGEITAPVGEPTSRVPQPSNTGDGNSTDGPTVSLDPTNFASPAGALIPTDNTTGNGTVTDAPVVMAEDSGTASSWRVFQIFLVLCLVGVVALGFLYWRKKRRQDDEIPMFTRSSHTDYHNPTFTADDDASFVSRGGRHNYKSFE